MGGQEQSKIVGRPKGSQKEAEYASDLDSSSTSRFCTRKTLHQKPDSDQESFTDSDNDKGYTLDSDSDEGSDGELNKITSPSKTSPTDSQLQNITESPTLVKPFSPVLSLTDEDVPASPTFQRSISSEERRPSKSHTQSRFCTRKTLHQKPESHQESFTDLDNNKRDTLDSDSDEEPDGKLNKITSPRKTSQTDSQLQNITESPRVVKPFSPVLSLTDEDVVPASPTSQRNINSEEGRRSKSSTRSRFCTRKTLHQKPDSLQESFWDSHNDKGNTLDSDSGEESDGKLNKITSPRKTSPTDSQVQNKTESPTLVKPFSPVLSLMDEDVVPASPTFQRCISSEERRPSKSHTQSRFCARKTLHQKPESDQESITDLDNDKGHTLDSDSDEESDDELNNITSPRKTSPTDSQLQNIIESPTLIKPFSPVLSLTGEDGPASPTSQRSISSEERRPSKSHTQSRFCTRKTLHQKPESDQESFWDSDNDKGYTLDSDSDEESDGELNNRIQPEQMPVLTMSTNRAPVLSHRPLQESCTSKKQEMEAVTGSQGEPGHSSRGNNEEEPLLSKHESNVERDKDGLEDLDLDINDSEYVSDWDSSSISSSSSPPSSRMASPELEEFPKCSNSSVNKREEDNPASPTSQSTISSEENWPRRPSKSPSQSRFSARKTLHQKPDSDQESFWDLNNDKGYTLDSDSDEESDGQLNKIASPGKTSSTDSQLQNITKSPTLVKPFSPVLLLTDEDVPASPTSQRSISSEERPSKSHTQSRFCTKTTMHQKPDSDQESFLDSDNDKGYTLDSDSDEESDGKLNNKIQPEQMPVLTTNTNRAPVLSHRPLQESCNSKKQEMEAVRGSQGEPGHSSKGDNEEEPLLSKHESDAGRDDDGLEDLDLDINDSEYASDLDSCSISSSSSPPSSRMTSPELEEFPKCSNPSVNKREEDNPASPTSQSTISSEENWPRRPSKSPTQSRFCARKTLHQKPDSDQESFCDSDNDKGYTLDSDSDEESDGQLNKITPPGKTSPTDSQLQNITKSPTLVKPFSPVLLLTDEDVSASPTSQRSISSEERPLKSHTQSRFCTKTTMHQKPDSDQESFLDSDNDKGYTLDSDSDEESDGKINNRIQPEQMPVLTTNTNRAPVLSHRPLQESCNSKKQGMEAVRGSQGEPGHSSKGDNEEEPLLSKHESDAGRDDDGLEDLDLDINDSEYASDLDSSSISSSSSPPSSRMASPELEEFPKCSNPSVNKREEDNPASPTSQSTISSEENWPRRPSKSPTQTRFCTRKTIHQKPDSDQESFWDSDNDKGYTLDSDSDEESDGHLNKITSPGKTSSTDSQLQNITKSPTLIKPFSPVLLLTDEDVPASPTSQRSISSEERPSKSHTQSRFCTKTTMHQKPDSDQESFLDSDNDKGYTLDSDSDEESDGKLNNKIQPEQMPVLTTNTNRAPVLSHRPLQESCNSKKQEMEAVRGSQGEPGHSSKGDNEEEPLLSKHESDAGRDDDGLEDLDLDINDSEYASDLDSSSISSSSSPPSSRMTSPELEEFPKCSNSSVNKREEDNPASPTSQSTISSEENWPRRPSKSPTQSRFCTRKTIHQKPDSDQESFWDSDNDKGYTLDSDSDEESDGHLNKITSPGKTSSTDSQLQNITKSPTLVKPFSPVLLLTDEDVPASPTSQRSISSEERRPSKSHTQSRFCTKTTMHQKPDSDQESFLDSDNDKGYTLDSDSDEESDGHLNKITSPGKTSQSESRLQNMSEPPILVKPLSPELSLKEDVVPASPTSQTSISSEESLPRRPSKSPTQSRFCAKTTLHQKPDSDQESFLDSDNDKGYTLDSDSEEESDGKLNNRIQPKQMPVPSTNTNRAPVLSHRPLQESCNSKEQEMEAVKITLQLDLVRGGGLSLSSLSDLSDDEGVLPTSGQQKVKNPEDLDIAKYFHELTQSFDKDTDDTDSPTSWSRQASLSIQKQDSEVSCSTSMEHIFDESFIQKARNCNRHLTNKVEDLKGSLREFKYSKSVLESNQLELKNEVTLLKLQLKREQDSHSYSREQLRKTKEEHQFEVQERQNMELKFRNMELEKRMLINNVNQLEEDHSKTQGLLAQEHSARILKENLLYSHVRKIQEMEEDQKRNMSKSSEVLSQLTKAKDRERELLQKVSALQKQLTVFRTDLEQSQTNSSLKENHLRQENEALKEQLKDLQRDLRLSNEAKTQTGYSSNSQLTKLKDQLKVTTLKLENERQTRETLEEVVESKSSQLAEAVKELTQSRANSVLKENQLRQENKTLQEQLKDLQRDLKLSNETVTQTVFSCNNHLAKLKEKLSVTTTKLEKERDAHKRLEAEVESKRGLLETTKREGVSSDRATQERLVQAQNEAASLRKQLEEAQIKTAAVERALTENKERYTDMLSKTCSDYERRIRQVENKNKELIRKAADLEEEKAQLVKDSKRLIQKWEESKDQYVQTERYINSLESRLNEKEKELVTAAQKLQEALSSNVTIKRLEEAVQNLETENARLEATVKKQSNKIRALQQIKDKAKETEEQKKAVDTCLDEEKKKNAKLQKDVDRWRTLLKTAKTERSHLEIKNVELQDQAASLKSLRGAKDELERSKRQLEEEVLTLRQRLEVARAEQSRAEQFYREAGERTWQETAQKLEKVSLFMQSQAESQRAQDQIRDATEVKMRSLLQQRTHALEEELIRSRTIQQDSLHQRDVAQRELQRCRQLREELHLRDSITASLERTNRHQETSSMLLSERITNGSLVRPSLKLGSSGLPPKYGTVTIPVQLTF